LKKPILIAIAIAAFAASAFAQLPPGKWWRRPEIINQLALTEDQQTRLDGIFRGSANDLIDLRGDVEKQNIALRGELDQPQLNRANIRKIAAQLNEARGRLFERELSMLVDMRAVLSDQQWNRMRSALDRLREGGQQQMPRKMRPR
jgi:Spy/CpxP family protein refolding chaperone